MHVRGQEQKHGQREQRGANIDRPARGDSRRYQFELAAKARARGNIHYQVVEMTAGAMITGRLIHADQPMAQLTGPEAGA